MCGVPTDLDLERFVGTVGPRGGWPQVDAPRSVTLEFDTGHRLQGFDSSREYESFTIQPGEIIASSGETTGRLTPRWSGRASRAAQRER